MSRILFYKYIIGIFCKSVIISRNVLSPKGYSPPSFYKTIFSHVPRKSYKTLQNKEFDPLTIYPQTIKL